MYRPLGLLPDHLENLEKANYPYDMVHLRYDIGSDNGPPDPRLPDIVREWNKRYAYPKLVISTVGETFREFEKGAGHYSWWTYRAGARERNIGWRIDYVMASAALRGDVVYTSDVGDLRALAGFFAGVTILGF